MPDQNVFDLDTKGIDGASDLRLEQKHRPELDCRKSGTHGFSQKRGLFLIKEL